MNERTRLPEINAENYLGYETLKGATNSRNNINNSASDRTIAGNEQGDVSIKKKRQTSFAKPAAGSSKKGGTGRVGKELPALMKGGRGLRVGRGQRVVQVYPARGEKKEGESSSSSDQEKKKGTRFYF